MSSFQEIENFQTQSWEEHNIDHCNEEQNDEQERELEEALSLSDLPITTGNQEVEAKNRQSENQNAEDNFDSDSDFDFDFDFGSLIGSMSTLNGEMCTADEVFSGGQILPYRNSVSSMSGLRSVSRSDSMDRRGFTSRSSNSRSSSVRSHYSAASSSGSSSCSDNTGISVKTVPVLSKTRIQNQFHSFPSPKPQIVDSGVRFTSHGSAIGKKSKMWEVLKLGLVRTPEIELIPRNNSSGSNTGCNGNNNNNNNNGARKSIDGSRINDFVLEMQKRKKKLVAENKIGDNGGFFRSCKCSVMAIDPFPIRPNYDMKSGYYGNRQKNSPGKYGLNEDKNVAKKKVEQLQQEQGRNSQIRQGKQVISHHHNRTFEWLKNLSNSTLLNTHS
ncbi:uncharacterized protein LOC130820767 [Amaranthus tricolor]|uniref:uncharacterized protein LOC130820767 n=1 Tax=Amaranthus tricolor TaxID=29722 RepID=UPI00258CEF4A|nr:uncharacterized protein LOC130820767 [Amaranthus tricolor]